MREVSFVKRLKFNFDGSVTKRALVIGDADNDGRNELVCANLQGHLAVFKGSSPDKFAHAENLGMVTACSIGDIMNSARNHVTAINMEGWLFIFDVQASGPLSAAYDKAASRAPRKLEPMYEQRMPANCKEMLLADLDGDGQNELIIGLTDRVLRTYKWVKIGPEQGKFVGLYKWEFADQIGSVSLNPSRHENCQDIIVAQPGGTYAKLECFDKKPLTSSKSTSSSLDEQAAKLDSSKSELSGPGLGAGAATAIAAAAAAAAVTSFQKVKEEPGDDGDNVRTEYVNKLTPEYHQLALAQMRNHHVSTEVLGNIREGRGSSSFSLIVIATLDGTLMLVNKDEILWSLQVDHQLFALAVLEAAPQRPSRPTMAQSESTCTIVPAIGTGTGTEIESHQDALGEGACARRDGAAQRCQHFAACAWNGKTYIIDEERNYLRFKFDEAVSAFTAGHYHFDERDHSCLAYATFNSQIILYYDVLLDSVRPAYLLDEIMSNPAHADLLRDLNKLANALEGELRAPGAICAQDRCQRDDHHEDHHQDHRRSLYRALNELLYNVNDQDLLLPSSPPPPPLQS